MGEFIEKLKRDGDYCAVATLIRLATVLTMGGNSNDGVLSNAHLGRTWTCV